jgi:membrane-bound lytic murein transglycosylase A
LPIRSALAGLRGELRAGFVIAAPGWIAAAVLAAFAVSGCTGARAPLPLAKVVAGDQDDLDPPSLAITAERTAEALERRKNAPVYRLGKREVSLRDLARSARRIAEIASEEKDARGVTLRLSRECKAWPAGVPAKVTGYFEPLLEARERPDSRFRYPIYAAPSQAQLGEVEQKLGRTPTRADIDRSRVLEGRGLELAWVDDPVARFFLHVQGSGRLRFPSGRERRIGFAATNDLPYQSVGRIMLDEGKLERGQASATAMRRWLAEHPSERDELLERNPRYVFFRDTGAEGPVGSLGVTLVAGRSIAVDNEYVPPGMFAWLRTTRPVVDGEGDATGKQPVRRFAFAQDTGAAIKGAARVDLFFGSGEQAGFEAGGMNEAGELYLLLCAFDPPGPILGAHGRPLRGRVR